MTTFPEAVQDTLRHLGGDRSALNRLSTSSLGEGETSIVLELDLNGIRPGVDLEIVEPDKGKVEVVKVWHAGPNVTRDLADRYVEVQRGVNGTRPLHWGREDPEDPAEPPPLVRIQPKHFYWDLQLALRDEIAGLSAEGLYSENTIEANYSESDGLIPFASDYLSVYAVEVHNSGFPNDWRFDFREIPGGLRVHGLNDGKEVTVHYRSPLEPPDLHAEDKAAIDLHETLGLPSTAQDIPPIGAATRTLLAKEAIRNEVEAHDHARRAEDVPPRSITSLVNQLRGTRDLRLALEIRKLRQRWPLRQR